MKKRLPGKTLSACLEAMGCRVTALSTASQALAALGRQPFDLAFLDLSLKEMSGLDLLPKFLSLSTNLHIVMITAYATIETAVEAIKRGARDYLTKNLSTWRKSGTCLTAWRRAYRMCRCWVVIIPWSRSSGSIFYRSWPGHQPLRRLPRSWISIPPPSGASAKHMIRRINPKMVKGFLILIYQV